MNRTWFKFGVRVYIQVAKRRQHLKLQPYHQTSQKETIVLSVT